jgi:hypothetical protein
MSNRRLERRRREIARRAVSASDRHGRGGSLQSLQHRDQSAGILQPSCESVAADVDLLHLGRLEAARVEQQRGEADQRETPDGSARRRRASSSAALR